MEAELLLASLYQMVIYYTVTFLFVLVANSMLIFGFYKTSRPFTIVTKLFIYLSICEVVQILCLTFVSVAMTMELSRGFSLEDHWYKFCHFIIYPSVLMASLIFWTISFLRFLSIYKPMYRVKTQTVHKILMVELLICFLLAILIVLVYIFTREETAQQIVALGLPFVLIFMNLTLNLLSLILLRRSTNSKARKATDNVSNNTMVIKQKKTALKTLLLITIVQVACISPYAILTLISFSQAMNGFNMFAFLQSLHLSNTGINSLIVILRTKHLREFYRLSCFPRNRNHPMEMAEMRN